MASLYALDYTYNVIVHWIHVVFPDIILNQQNTQANTDSTTVSSSPNSASGLAQSDIQRDLLELTQEIANLRNDLQQSQELDSQN